MQMNVLLYQRLVRTAHNNTSNKMEKILFSPKKKLVVRQSTLVLNHGFHPNKSLKPMKMKWPEVSIDGWPAIHTHTHMSHYCAFFWRSSSTTRASSRIKREEGTEFNCSTSYLHTNGMERRVRKKVNKFELVLANRVHRDGDEYRFRRRLSSHETTTFFLLSFALFWMQFSLFGSMMYQSIVGGERNPLASHRCFPKIESCVNYAVFFAGFTSKHYVLLAFISLPPSSSLRPLLFSSFLISWRSFLFAAIVNSHL